MIRSAQIPIGPARVQLSIDDTGITIGSTVSVRATVDMYIGGSDVTTVNGHLLPAGTPLAGSLDAGETLWAVTSGATGTAYVLAGSV